MRMRRTRGFIGLIIQKECHLMRRSAGVDAHRVVSQFRFISRFHSRRIIGIMTGGHSVPVCRTVTVNKTSTAACTTLRSCFCVGGFQERYARACKLFNDKARKTSIQRMVGAGFGRGNVVWRHVSQRNEFATRNPIECHADVPGGG